jgi:peptide-methionine (S)-S-oxide reductase
MKGEQNRKVTRVETDILKYMKQIVILMLCAAALGVVAAEPAKPMNTESNRTELATFAGGCFWCTEAVFERLPGVLSVTSGYCGGHLENPDYKSVITSTTGHAEAIQIAFDPAKLSYAKLLEVFWIAHDPTTLNRQGADVGTQYRSSIFYHDDTQKQTAEKSKTEAQKNFSKPIVTEIAPLKKFYKAEGYHQDYYRNNPNAGYCQVVIKPKLDKLEKILGKEDPK